MDLDVRLGMGWMHGWQGGDTGLYWQSWAEMCISKFNAKNSFCWKQNWNRNQGYCKTGNIHVQENFAIFAKIARFAKMSCMPILQYLHKVGVLSFHWAFTESWKPLLFINSRNFPVAKLPTPRIREIFLSWNFPVIQYQNEVESESVISFLKSEWESRINYWNHTLSEKKCWNIIKTISLAKFTFELT